MCVGARLCVRPLRTHPRARAEESEDRETGAPARGTTRRQHVVRAKAVVAEDPGGLGAEEEGAGVVEVRPRSLGVFEHDLEVLWGERVAGSVGGGEVFAHDGETVREEGGAR